MFSVTLLLVDDSDIDRYVARRLFTRADDGLDVIEFGGGRAALEFLRDNEVPAGCTILLMLDLNMPEMNGFEFLQEFAELKKTRVDLDRCLVNVLTSSNHPDDLHRSESFPFVQRHFVKMPDGDELLALLDGARSGAR